MEQRFVSSVFRFVFMSNILDSKFAQYEVLFSSAPSCNFSHVVFA